MTLLLLILMVSIHVYGRSATDRPQDRMEQSEQKGRFSSNQFGRRNPFMPLTAEDMDAIAVYNGLTMDQTEPDSDNSGADSSIHLTAVFVVADAQGGKNTATIEEKGVSRSITVGDTVAGMEVIEIRRGEVVLGNETEKHTITLGIPFKAKSDPDG